VGSDISSKWSLAAKINTTIAKARQISRGAVVLLEKGRELAVPTAFDLLRNKTHTIMLDKWIALVAARQCKHSMLCSIRVDWAFRRTTIGCDIAD